MTTFRQLSPFDSADPHDTRPITADPPRESDFDDWTNAPVLLRMSPKPGYKMLTRTDGRARMRVNCGDVYEFDTPEFAGRMTMFIRGCEGSEEYADVWEDKKRQTWAVVQGRFKTAIGMDRCAGTLDQ